MSFNHLQMIFFFETGPQGDQIPEKDVKDFEKSDLKIWIASPKCGSKCSEVIRSVSN